MAVKISTPATSRLKPPILTAGSSIVAPAAANHYVPLVSNLNGSQGTNDSNLKWVIAWSMDSAASAMQSVRYLVSNPRPYGWAKIYTHYPGTSSGTTGPASSLVTIVPHFRR